MRFQFSGINIYSKKPKVVFDFYKKLGFRVLEEVPSDNKWYGSTLALQDGADTPMIWIWRRSDEDDNVVCNHFVFSADGKMNEIYETITAAGIECNPHFIAAWGGMEFILHDPEGNELLFL